MSSTAHTLTVEVANGVWGTVECVVCISQKVPAQEFLEQELRRLCPKGKDQPGASAEAKLLALFERMAEYGPSVFSDDRFGKEGALGMYAFKHEVCGKLIRFPCFQDGKRWLLTHGFFKPGAQKKKGKWRASEVNRALEIKAEYVAKKQQITKRNNRQ